MRAVSLLLVIASCAEPDEVRVDEATICVLPAPAGMDADEIASTAPWSFDRGHPQTYEPSERVVVVAELAYPGCQDDAEMSCEIVQSGAALGIRTHARWNTPSPQRACTRELHKLRAVCLSPALADRTYSLVYAGEQQELAVPSTSLPPCFRME